jgi:3-phosphoshikimate 1-carboxyvinyltransferase
MGDVLSPPVSKSDAHRALVLAEMRTGQHEAFLAMATDIPRDVDVISRGLVALRGERAEIDCIDAGAPFRFLVTQACLKRPGAEWTFRGTPRLAERPHQALFESLTCALDVGIAVPPSGWPLRIVVHSDRMKAPFRVDGAASSQFVSSVLLGAATLAQARGHSISVEAKGEVASEGYLALTLDWMRRFGFSVDLHDGQYRVDVPVTPQLPTSLPGDWSSLTYLLPLAWIAGLGVERVDRTSIHPDAVFANHLESAGLRLRTQGVETRVEGELERGFEVDASKCPDAVPALVAMALRCPESSRFRRCAVLRLKESDRLTGCADLAKAVGGRATVEGDELTVTPVTTPKVVGTFDGQEDHRLVMAAAVAARLLSVSLPIRGTSAVRKSFPAFWEQASKAGVQRIEADA